LDRFLNQIICGDCLEVMKELPDKSVDMILTDIPYGNVSKHGEERARYTGQLRKIDKGLADIETFDISDFIAECYRIAKGSIYIFCGIPQVSKIFSYFDNKQDMMTRRCIWKKTNPSPMNGEHMWLSSTEDCIFAKFRKTDFNQKCKSSVWEFPCGRSKVHPTEKPLKLFEYLIQSSSNEGDIIFDPCMGSGTTAIAAHNTGRFFIGIEKEPKYVEIAKKRLEQAQSQQSLFG
jgi:site-specific DNA-methyltransferase (adenine-specific)